MLTGRLFCPESRIKLYTLLMLLTTTTSIHVQLQRMRQHISVNNYNFLKIPLIPSKYFHKEFCQWLITIQLWLLEIYMQVGGCPKFYFFISFSMKSMFRQANVPYASTCQGKNKSFRVDSHSLTVASLGQPQEF